MARAVRQGFAKGCPDRGAHVGRQHGGGAARYHRLGMPDEAVGRLPRSPPVVPVPAGTARPRREIAAAAELKVAAMPKPALSTCIAGRPFRA